MTFNQLRYFQAVCKYGGINKASEILHIAQPSISNSIKALEEEFGVLLFSRENKRLVLTEEGREFLRSADRILKDADDTLQFMQALGERRIIKLGVPPMLSSRVTPILYQSYLEKRPDFELQIAEGDRVELFEQLESDQINIVLLPYNKPFPSKYCSQDIARLQNVCCVSREHPFAGRTLLSIKDLSKEPLILFKNSFFQTEQILERFALESVSPQVLLHTVQLSTLEQMVQKTLGVGFVYEFVTQMSPRLVGIPLDPPIYTDICLVWKKDGSSFININKFLKFAEILKKSF